MRTLILLPLCLALAGCGAHGPFRDRGNDYLQADPGKPLVYPDGMPAIAAREAWPVPDPDLRRQPAAGEELKTVIPPPPRIVPDDTEAAEGSGAGQPVPPAKVLLTEDGNGHPVLMLELDFDWAWQGIGDALKGIDEVKVEDLDRGLAIYYLAMDGKRAAGGDPYQLKLNYTANGIQVALQVDENAMAAKELAAPLMEKLRDGLLK